VALQTGLTGMAMGVSSVPVIWLVTSLLWYRDGITCIESSPFVA